MRAPAAGPAPRPDTGPPAPAEAPALTRRMAAWLYEGVLLFGVVMLAGFVFSIATGMRHGLQGRAGLVAFLFVVLGAYFVVSWVRAGQTLAMRTWRVRLRDRHGRPLTWGRACIRYAFCYIWLLPPLAAFGTHQVTPGAVLVITAGWVAFWALLSRLHPQRQFWHDALAGTRLEPAPPVARPKQRS